MDEIFGTHTVQSSASFVSPLLAVVAKAFDGEQEQSISEPAAINKFGVRRGVNRIPANIVFSGKRSAYLEQVCEFLAGSMFG